MRGPERGRRSPQPRGQDRRYPAAGGQRYAGDRRRRSSMSPGRGRSPVHYNNKRMRGPDGPYDQAPGRYDDRDFEAAYDGYHPEQYRPVSPRGARQNNGPKSYKAYMMELPDDITPEDAQKKYDEYLTHFWGSARKAYFQSIKDKSETKAKFHPLEQAKGKKVRNEEAQEAAKKFAERLLSGGLNPASKDFNQGEGLTDPKSADTVMAEDGAQPQGDAAAQASTQVAPALLWKPERVAADLKLSRQLIEKLDEEKGVTSNPLIAADQLNGTSTEETAKENEPAAASNAEEGSKPETAAPGDTEMTAADAEVPSKKADPKTDSPTKTSYQMSVKTDEKSAAVSDSQAGDASTHEATTEVKAAAQVEGASNGSSPGDVGKLDVHLTYLWEVHRVNFYVGGEWWDPSDCQRWQTQRRMVRAPHPEEGEQPDAEQEKLESAQVKKMVDQVWQTRLASGDPLEALLHTGQIEEAVDKWVEDKVVKHSDTKWGNALSTKMFVGKDFVLKHIRVKHAEKVDEFKNKMYEDLYWQNYDDMESNRIELAKQAKRDARLAAEAANKEEDLEMPIELQQGSGPFPGLAARHVGDADEQGGSGDHANGVQRSGSGLGRNAPKRGRGRPAGGRGQMRGDMGMGGPMAPVGAGMMGGMQAMPGQMFVLAPGAGPLGPFIQVPIPPGGPEQMGMGPQIGNGLPRGGSRGPARIPRAQSGGRGGYGGGPMPMGGRGYGGRGGYYDLDAPENQRGVLDYGDL